jgi:hypothetical protein
MSTEDLPGGAALVALRGRLDVAGAGAIELKFNATAGARRYSAPIAAAQPQAEAAVDTAPPGSIEALRNT